MQKNAIYFPSTNKRLYKTYIEPDKIENNQHLHVKNYFIEAFKKEMEIMFKKQLEKLQNNKLDLEKRMKELESQFFKELKEQKNWNNKRHVHMENYVKQLLMAQHHHVKNQELQPLENAFQLGDRITVIDINGTTNSGVFIKFTENDIVWVSDTTNRLTYTNKKGITIAKET